MRHFLLFFFLFDNFIRGIWIRRAADKSARLAQDGVHEVMLNRSERLPRATKRPTETAMKDGRREISRATVFVVSDYRKYLIASPGIRQLTRVAVLPLGQPFA